jgi:hypothetical protein
MTIKIIPVFLLFNLGFSQINNLTSSPYSLFGLGKLTESNIGITNSLGKAGIALTSENELNGLNPASLVTIKLNNFFFDFGVKAAYNNFGDKTSESSMPSFGFTNISFGFPLSSKSGASVSLIPFTEVGYFFQGLVENIDGSTDTFQSSIIGSGGLNSLNFNYGRKITDKLNIGLSVKYLFGNIKQQEIVTLSQDLLIFDETNRYEGFVLGTGFQYQVMPKLNVSSVVNFNSTLAGLKDRNVQKFTSSFPSNIENSTNIKLEAYKMPLEVVFGIKYDFKSYYFVSDYKRFFWKATNQRDNIGRFVDSNVFSFGIEKFNNSEFVFKNRFRYRIGYNFDDGNLSINSRKISSSSYTAGIGIPIGTNMKSYLNISYSYGSSGLISNTLVKENYHMLTFNLDFADHWFMKRKYD